MALVQPVGWKRGMYHGLVLADVYWNMDVPADSWYGGISDIPWNYKF